MPLKKSKGNMYDWVSHTHSHLRGKCSHNCKYCYVQAMAEKFDDMKEKYSGKVSIIKEELNVKYGKNKIIFIDHMNDLFAQELPMDLVATVLHHCLHYSENQYVFQTKNPKRYAEFIGSLPNNSILGTTIESNRRLEAMGDAPSAFNRTIGIEHAKYMNGKMRPTFITIEPILDFDLEEFAEMIIFANPTFVNIGADSKGQDLPEPPYSKILELYELLIAAGIEVRKKINLERLEKLEK